jgi:hypothetical protein
MEKETLTIYTDEDGRVIYTNADGERHNPHGPAIVYADGKKWYYINDKELSEAEFKAWQVQQDAPLHNKIAVIGGVEYTLTEK